MKILAEGVGTDLHMYMCKTYTQKRWELVQYIEVDLKGNLLKLDFHLK
jgi:hypothetical protein